MFQGDDQMKQASFCWQANEHTRIAITAKGDGSVLIDATGVLTQKELLMLIKMLSTFVTEDL
jgi:hypothetical protein